MAFGVTANAASASLSLAASDWSSVVSVVGGTVVCRRRGGVGIRIVSSSQQGGVGLAQLVERQPLIVGVGQMGEVQAAIRCMLIHVSTIELRFAFGQAQSEPPAALPHEFQADVPAVIEDVAVVVGSATCGANGLLSSGGLGIEVLRGQGHAIDKQELVAAAERPLIVEAIGRQQVGLADERDVVGSADRSRKTFGSLIGADGRVDVHVIAIYAGLQLAAGAQAGQHANPQVAAELNARQVVGRVGVVVRAGRDEAGGPSADHWSTS